MPLTFFFSFRFTFAEFCYALLLVSDDLSIEQLMCCENAERILAKRRDALQSLNPNPATQKPSTSPSSSPKIQPSAPTSATEDTPRGSRLLLFVQARPASQQPWHHHAVCCGVLSHALSPPATGHYRTSDRGTRAQASAARKMTGPNKHDAVDFNNDKTVSLVN
jgi:hypothetical protein